MSGYVKRTCSECGYRDIQPNMIKTVKRVETGRGDSKIDGSTFLGVLLEIPNAKKRFNSVLWANNRRVYTREKTIWLCNACAEEEEKSTSVTSKIINALTPAPKSKFDIFLEKFMTAVALFTFSSFFILFIYSVLFG